jgi:hypothetical protein
LFVLYGDSPMKIYMKIYMGRTKLNVPPTARPGLADFCTQRFWQKVDHKALCESRTRVLALLNDSRNRMYL